MASTSTNQTPTKTGHTKIRHVRVPDDRWATAAEQAERDGLTISGATNMLLAMYGDGRIKL